MNILESISIKYYNMPGFSNHNCIAGIPLIALMGAGDKGGAPTAPAKSLYNFGAAFRFTKKHPMGWIDMEETLTTPLPCVYLFSKCSSS